MVIWCFYTEFSAFCSNDNCLFCARMNILNALEPKKLPAESSGEPMLMELMEVRSSGREVAPARSRTPINIPPSLVRAAITSPYLANCIAATTIRAAATTKVTQTQPPVVAAICIDSNMIFSFCLFYFYLL